MPDPTISNVVTTLAPAFAAGFAVQQGLQILDSLLNLDKKITPIMKTGLAGLISLGLGFVFAASGIHVLAPLMAIVSSSASSTPNTWVDMLVTALVISGGTEGFNSIMKFLGYKKDGAKTDNLQKLANANTNTDNAQQTPTTGIADRAAA